MSNVSVMGLPNSRPPFVNFEERSVEDREASIAAGRLIMKSVDYVIISQPGSKDSVEKEAVPWLDSLRQNANYDPMWVDRFKTHYRMWKEGNEITPDGTHIRMWAPISKAEAETLIAARVRTVEDLAAANEETLRMIGMGARALQNKARAWLESASNTGKTTEEIVALRALTEAQAKEIESLRAKNHALARASAAQVKPAETSPAEANDDFL